MDRHEDLPGLHSAPFKQMRFNVEFTAETLGLRVAEKRTPTINHGAAPFIENKRYRTKRAPARDVVNRNAVSVYQTDQVFICIVRTRRRCSGAAGKTVTKQYRVRRCSEK
jgi:hypothetical protein